MCRIELATNTITAESRMGSHKALMGTMRFSSETDFVVKGPVKTRQSLPWLVMRVNRVGRTLLSANCATKIKFVGAPSLSLRSLERQGGDFDRNLPDCIHIFESAKGTATIWNSSS